jgi:hypothetical protein
MDIILADITVQYIDTKSKKRPKPLITKVLENIVTCREENESRHARIYRAIKTKEYKVINVKEKKLIGYTSRPISETK